MICLRCRKITKTSWISNTFNLTSPKSLHCSTRDLLERRDGKLRPMMATANTNFAAMSNAYHTQRITTICKRGNGRMAEKKAPGVMEHHGNLFVSSVWVCQLVTRLWYAPSFQLQFLYQFRFFICFILFPLEQVDGLSRYLFIPLVMMGRRDAVLYVFPSQWLVHDLGRYFRNFMRMDSSFLVCFCFYCLHFPSPRCH